MRVGFCVAGVILLWIANIMFEMGFAIDEVNLTLYDAVAFPLYGVGVWLVVHGSYLWAKEKARSGWWSLAGLIAPFGYIILWKLKDKKASGDARVLEVK